MAWTIHWIQCVSSHTTMNLHLLLLNRSKVVKSNELNSVWHMILIFWLTFLSSPRLNRLNYYAENFRFCALNDLLRRTIVRIRIRFAEYMLNPFTSTLIVCSISSQKLVQLHTEYSLNFGVVKYAQHHSNAYKCNKCHTNCVIKLCRRSECLLQCALASFHSNETDIAPG